MAERYPAFRAGQKVTGELLASMQPLTVRKASDLGRTSTTRTADPELQVTVEANAVYTMTATGFMTATNATTDINFEWSVPTGSDGTWSGIGSSVAATTDSDGVRIVGTSFNGGSRSWGVTSASSAAPNIVQLTGLLIVGSTAGTLSLMWGANSASGTVNLLTDSGFDLQRIA